MVPDGSSQQVTGAERRIPTSLGFSSGAHGMLGKALLCPNKPTLGFLGTQLSSGILPEEWMLPSGLSTPISPTAPTWGKPPPIQHSPPKP